MYFVLCGNVTHKCAAFILSISSYCILRSGCLRLLSIAVTKLNGLDKISAQHKHVKYTLSVQMLNAKCNYKQIKMIPVNKP